MESTDTTDNPRISTVRWARRLHDPGLDRREPAPPESQGDTALAFGILIGLLLTVLLIALLK